MPPVEPGPATGLAITPPRKKVPVWPFIVGGAVLLIAIAAVLYFTGVFAPQAASAPASAEEMLSEAQQLLDDGEYKDAARAFKRYIREEPDDPAGYMGLAQAYVALGDNDEAIEALQDGMEATDGDSDIADYLKSLQDGTAPAVVTTTSEAPAQSEQLLSPDAQAYSDTIYEMNTAAGEGGIDPYEIKRQPAPRDTTLIWDKSIYNMVGNSFNFSSEGYITYNVERKQLINKATGNRMEYEIYTHPNTGKVNKIVSIEYLGDTLEITDYYYTNDGKPNFVFQRMDTVYTPESAMLTMLGERYFFTNDTMVRWRIIDDSGSGRTEIPVGVNEDVRGAAEPQYVTLYNNLTPSMRALYDEKEVKYLNAAYNTMETVMASKGMTNIVGAAVDKDDNPMPGATVKLYSEAYGAWVYECQTDSDGGYSISVPSEEGTFRIQVLSDGCSPVDIYGIGVTPQIIDAYQDTACLVSDSLGSVDVRLLVIDAFNETNTSYGDSYAQGLLRLEGAQVCIRPGLNNRTGEMITQALSDGSGWVAVTLAPGCYTAEIIKDGYVTAYLTVVVRAANEVLQLPTSPELGGGELRIVLTWGDSPYDLDSHLFTPYGADSSDTTYHIWYGHMSDANANNLDVDDTTSYGPETMTINYLGTGLYKYYVADYTNCSSGDPASFEMSESGATVSVYTNMGLVASFHVPANRSGVIWEVFEINNMQIVPIQRYYNNITDKPWWNQEK
jgi:tetratricopeptide (TPR) repeat protein